MITWLESPIQYAYLRKTRWAGPTKELNVKRFMTDKQGCQKVIGYELLSRKESGSFEFEVYWLKWYDRGISNSSTPYAGPDTYGGHMPVEAVNPKELVMEVV